MTLDSVLKSPSKVFQLRSFRSDPVQPHQPQTEQQHLKCGSTTPKYNVFKASNGRKDLAYFKIPRALVTLLETDLICSFQSKKLSM